MAMVMEVMDIVIRVRSNACYRRDGDADGSNTHCFRIEAVWHMIDVMAMVMDIVIELKL